MPVNKKHKPRIKRPRDRKNIDPALVDSVLLRKGTLFPEKLDRAKEIVSQIKFLP